MRLHLWAGVLALVSAAMAVAPRHGGRVMTCAVAVLEIVLAIARLLKTVVRAWAMPLSVPSAMRWSTHRWPSRSWRHKPMAKP